MAFVTLIPFDRPLAGGVIPGQTGPLFTETEVAGRLQAAYHAGADAARAFGDQQMVEFRFDMQQLSEGVLKKVGGIELLLVAQLRQALPSLAQEIARRLFADFEPPPEVIERFWREALDQLYPEREGLELALCPRDAELLEQLNPEWRQRYPGLLLRVDPSLVRGDCLVRSRFGLIDARQKTKLQGLERALVGA
jgi:flagellar assembly protein FliH